MSEKPIHLTQQFPRVSGNRKIHDDFTLYVNKDLDLPSLVSTKKLGQGGADQHEWLAEATEVHDDRHPRKIISRTIDTFGPVVFGKPLSECEPGRIHAAPCFGGGFYSVTLRSLGTPQRWEREGAQKLRELAKAFQQRPSHEARSRALPDEKAGRLPSKNFETIQCLAELLYEKCFPPSGGGTIPQSKGLVLFAGGTGSGKTTYLNSVLRRYLQGTYESLAQNRRPHVVSIGDPVETLLFEKSVDKHRIKDNGVLHAIAEHQRNSEDERPFDFTARVLGVDTPSVESALKDALRETPCAVVVSELRDDKDFVAALDFAATGHLIFATSHSTTLAESLARLLKVYNADTAAGRAKVAQRVLAVIHHHVIPGPPDFRFAKVPTKQNVPSIWIGNADGRRNLIADGLSSLVSRSPASQDETPSGVLGRYWVASQLASRGGPLLDSIVSGVARAQIVPLRPWEVDQLNHLFLIQRTGSVRILEHQKRHMNWFLSTARTCIGKTIEDLLKDTPVRPWEKVENRVLIDRLWNSTEDALSGTSLPPPYCDRALSDYDRRLFEWINKRAGQKTSFLTAYERDRVYSHIRKEAMKLDLQNR